MRDEDMTPEAFEAAWEHAEPALVVGAARVVTAGDLYVPGSTFASIVKSSFSIHERSITFSSPQTPGVTGPLAMPNRVA